MIEQVIKINTIRHRLGIMNQIKTVINFSRRRHLSQSTLLLSPFILAACGSSTSDTIIEQNEFIEGNAGNDLVGPFETALWFRSNGGNDQIFGSPEEDIIYLGSGESIVQTYAGDDLISFSGWGNQLDTGSGIDTLNIALSTSSNVIIDVPNEIMYRENLLSSFNNVIAGFEVINASLSETNFKIISTGNASQIQTGIGNDVIYVTGSTAGLDGDEGTDTVHLTVQSLGGFSVINLLDEIYQSGSGNPTHSLNNFENVIVEGNNEVRIIGNDFANYLAGGEGDDIIIGNGGSDTLLGGNGKDVFVLANPIVSGEMDTILDFETGSGGDVLQFQYGGTLSSSGFSFRVVDLVSGGKKTLTNNTEILLLTGSSYFNEDQLLSAINGTHGLEEHHAQLHGSSQICVWENQSRGSLNVSLISDEEIDGLFSDTIYTSVQLNDLNLSEFANFSAANFQIL